jgi:hypothetical protein
MRGEIEVHRERLIAALREIAAAGERSDGGVGTPTARLDRLRDDITAALALLENRPERMMRGRPLRTESRISIAPESDRR